MPSPKSLLSLPLFFSLFVATAILFFGCAQPAQVSDEKEGAAYSQLSEIGAAYLQYRDSSRKPPESQENLIPILGDSHSYQSVRDGTDLIILWGTEVPKDSGEPIVIGYESTSTNRSRLVLTSMGTMTMNEDEFRSAKFPAGHVPN